MGNLISKEALGIVIMTIMFPGLLMLSIYGITLDDFSFTRRSTEYCFSGIMKYVFCIAGLVLSSEFTLMILFYALVKVNILKKLEPNTIPNALILAPMVGSISVIMVSSIWATLNCG